MKVLMKVRAEILKGKRKMSLQMSLVLAAALLLVSANGVPAASGEETKKEIKEAAVAIKDYTVEQKDQAVKKGKELLEKLDGNMEGWEGRMKEKWDKLQDASKEKYEASKESLAKQRAELSVMLEKMQDNSGEAWDDVKGGFMDAYNTLNEKVKKAEEESAK